MRLPPLNKCVKKKSDTNHAHHTTRASYTSEYLLTNFFLRSSSDLWTEMNSVTSSSQPSKDTTPRRYVDPITGTSFDVQRISEEQGGAIRLKMVMVRTNIMRAHVLGLIEVNSVHKMIGEIGRCSISSAANQARTKNIVRAQVFQ